ncbi:hypothetical protein TNCV_4295251 [Trichonephila clavipes]|uniref:Uncharacterized protein n=1 Tax=Trichonephila clavipes TaxID=2585209 RepID=A0A8X6RQ89_TRICX|nr:hypothetical protein TNCV_4295251 [Trichonephila clavipes]
MQRVGKGSIVIEFRQRLQGHSSRKMFGCSVPLTTMRPIWLNLPLTQKGRYSTGLGNRECTRRSCSRIAFRGSEPGMIHRDHLGIVENRGNGEFDGHWLALVTLA